MTIKESDEIKLITQRHRRFANRTKLLLSQTQYKLEELRQQLKRRDNPSEVRLYNDIGCLQMALSGIANYLEETDFENDCVKYSAMGLGVDDNITNLKK